MFNGLVPTPDLAELAVTSAPSEELPDLAGELVEREAPAKKRMLIVVNPYASTVSDRLKKLVVYALQGRYEVDAIDTEAKDHATDITRSIANDGYDLVVAFGGDGTANEIANGLAGTNTPLSCLPGGKTNVFCRTLGIPRDIVEATEHLLAMADDFRPWKIDLGRVNGRHFLFATGIGLDAIAFKRWDEHPRLKARLGEYSFLSSILNAALRDYLRNPHHVHVEVKDGPEFEAIQVVVQNSDPATFFGKRPLRVCEDVHTTSGTLSLASLRALKPHQIPRIGYRILGGRTASDLKAVDHAEGFTRARVTSTDLDEDGAPRPFPLQVDGDYAGLFTEVEYGITPRALTVVA